MVCFVGKGFHHSLEQKLSHIHEHIHYLFCVLLLSAKQLGCATPITIMVDAYY